MKMGNILQSKYIRSIKDYIKKAVQIGVIDYVLSDIFQKIMVFVGGFIVVRILSKEDYGTYTYILNTFSILSICGDFGVSSAVLQFASVNYDDEKKKKDFISYGFYALHIVSFFSLLVIGIASFFYPFTIDGARQIFRILIVLPIFNNEIVYFQSLLRIELKNKEYARINLLSTAIHYIALISLGFVFGLRGAVIAAYPQSVLVLVIYIATVKLRKDEYKNISLTKQEKYDFWKFGLLMQVNTVSLTLLNYLDIYCLGITVKNPEAIAEYKVASTIPTAMYFIPKSIMFFMVPIMGRHKKELLWIRSTFKKIMIVNISVCSLLAVVLGVLANVVIGIVYGNQYLSSVPCYVVLLFGFVVYGVFQSTASNILSIQEKLKIILITSVSGAVLNIVLNICLINLLGSIGAAIATVTSHLFIGGVLTIYLFHFLKSGKNDANV